MTIKRLPHFRLRAAIASALLFAAVLASNGGLTLLPAAASPLGTVPAVSVTVPAGGTATMQVAGFALQPGANVPQDSLALATQPLAPDRLRTTLYYGLDWGYADTAPQQVALAIWWAQNGTWLSPDHAVAERIGSAAANSPGLPFWNASGQSLLTAAAQGQVTLGGLQLAAGGTSPAVGTGTLTITNSTEQAQVLYLPYGAVFTGASGSVLAWASDTGQAPPPPAATSAAVPPTATMQPLATATTPAGYKPGYTPTEEATATVGAPTASPTVEPPSPTAAASPTAPAADTPAPTIPPAQDAQAAGSKPAPLSGTVPDASAKPAPPQVTAAPVTGTSAGSISGTKTSNTTRPPASNEAAPPPPSAAPPSPVATAQQGAIAPSPVATGGAQPQPPKPELTQQATVSTSKPTETQPPAEKPTQVPTPTVSKPAVTDQATPTPEKVPPVPAPVVPGSDSGGPTINVAPGGGATSGTKQTSPPQPAALGQGPAPKTNPTTGGGPSSVPAWLALASVMMVLGGWSLRRMAQPIPLTETAEDFRED